MPDRLQYISQGNTVTEQIANIQSALAGGCSWIQLRFKNASAEMLRQLAFEVKDMCCLHNARLIINDHVPLALETGADGVHLGLTDMPVAAARKIIGPHKLIGGTANTLDQVLQRIDEGCDYIGLGPYRFTTTKEKLSPVLGVEGYRNILQQLPEGTTPPIYAIGGILPEDIAGLIAAGLYGIAVSGLITNAAKKQDIIEKIKEELYEKAGYCRERI